MLLLSNRPTSQTSVLCFPSLQKAPNMDPKLCLNTFFFFSLKKDVFGNEGDQRKGVVLQLR